MKSDKFLRFDKFTGLNTRLSPELLPAGQAQLAQDVLSLSGVLKGQPDVGTPLVANSSFPNANWIWLTGGGTWVWADDVRYALNDGPYTYVTQNGGPPMVFDARGGNPPYISGSFPRPLGVMPLAGVTWTIAANVGSILAGTYYYGISYITFDELESNIQDFNLVFTFTGSTNTIKFVGVESDDPRVSFVQLWRTTNGGLEFHRLGNAVQNLGNVTLIDNGTITDAELISLTATGAYVYDLLTWNAGGTPDSGTDYTSDHSPAPNVTRLSDRLHSIASGVDSAGSGILIGAVGNELRWSINGHVQYWPLANSMPLDHTIEAIFSFPGESVIFTTGGFYALSGNNDDQMVLNRLDAHHYIAPGAGKSAVVTPLGVIFLSSDGLAVFDGATSRLILTETIDISLWSGLLVKSAGFVNNRYTLFHSTGFICVDLTDGLGAARVFTSDVLVNTAVYTDFATPLVAYAQADMPFGLRRFGAVGDNAHVLYVAGGSKLDDSAPNYAGEVATNQLLSWDTHLNTWDTSLAPMPQAVMDPMMAYLNGYLYVYGGWTGSAYYMGLQVYDIATNTWSTPAISGTLDASDSLVHGAFATDTTGVDTTHIWGCSSGALGNAAQIIGVQQFDAATNVWSNLYEVSSPFGYAGGTLTYVPGAVFSDGHARLFAFGGTDQSSSFTATSQAYLYPYYAYNRIYAFDLVAGTVTDDMSSDGTGITSAQAAGVAPRLYPVAVWDNVSKKIIIQGGQGTTDSGTTSVQGLPLSDIWAFDPAVWVTKIAAGQPAASAWMAKQPTVVNFEERYWHGAALFSQQLFLVGGSSTGNDFNADLSYVNLQPLAQYANTPGLYTLTPNDGGNIRLWEGGAAKTWSWQTPDYVGADASTEKQTIRATMEYQGEITLSAVNDNNAAVAVPVTLNSTTRTPQVLYLPFPGATGASFGNKISWQISGKSAAAGNGTPSQVWSFSPEIVEETGL